LPTSILGLLCSALQNKSRTAKADSVKDENISILHLQFS
jgi:hypothetical protein